MRDIVYFRGVKATVRQSNFKFLAIAFLAIFTFVFSACNSTTTPPVNGGGGSVDPEGAAATVNGTTIKMEEVERAIKQQGQGQEAYLSPLELAQARLQTLDSLIQQEVMYQKAQKEGITIKDEDVTAEYNKAKQQSGLSQEKWDEEMKKSNLTEASIRDSIKKRLAISQLNDKITSKVEPPKEEEVTAFYNGNKDAFVKKRGVKLAAIVVDPADNGEGDTTKNPADATLKIKEIANELNTGGDFATIAREKSEDKSGLQGGDLGYISEDALKQNFGDQIAAGFMNPQFTAGRVAGPFNIQGRYYIFKLLERVEKDEAQTLETPGVRQQIIDALINGRKQLLAASYQEMAMNEAKVENYLARQVVDNPNNFSGARPAPPANANVNANVNQSSNTNTNVNTANVNSTGNANAVKPQTKPSVAVNTNAAVNANAKK